jgi:hypothetical protein
MGEPSLSSLFASLAQNTGVLVRQEMQLGITEIGDKARKASAHAVWVGAGVVAATVGIGALAAAAILALALVLPAWGAALATGAVFCGVGAALSLKAVASIKTIDPVPRLTVRTLRDDGAWIKEQVG